MNRENLWIKVCKSGFYYFRVSMEEFDLDDECWDRIISTNFSTFRSCNYKSLDVYEGFL